MAYIKEEYEANKARNIAYQKKYNHANTVEILRKKKEREQQRKDSKEFYCDICDLASSSKWALIRHINGKRHMKKQAPVEAADI